jgi:hypothetical protein
MNVEAPASHDVFVEYSCVLLIVYTDEFKNEFGTENGIRKIVFQPKVTDMLVNTINRPQNNTCSQQKRRRDSGIRVGPYIEPSKTMNPWNLQLKRWSTDDAGNTWSGQQVVAQLTLFHDLVANLSFGKLPILEIASACVAVGSHAVDRNFLVGWDWNVGEAVVRKRILTVKDTQKKGGNS